MADLVRHDGTGCWYDPDDPGDPTQSGGPAYSVTWNDTETLKRFCAGKRCLDIGTGVGVSANAMGEVAAYVVTLGVRQWEAENTWPRLRKIIVPTLDREEAARLGPYDVVFIDGDHSEPAVVKDIEFAATVIVPGGTLMLHDVNFDSVSVPARRLLGEYILFPSAAGIGVVTDWRPA